MNLTTKQKKRLEAVRDWLAPVAAVVAVFISIKACIQSSASNETAAKSYDLAMRNSSPDFLLETDPLGTDLRPGPLKIVARLKNVGPATAFRVVAYGRIDPFKATEMKELSFEIPHAANQDLEPQHTMPVFLGPQFTLTEVDVAELKSGRIGLAFTVVVRSDPSTPGAERPDKLFRRAYDRATGEWIRGFPGGNPDFETR